MKKFFIITVAVVSVTAAVFTGCSGRGIDVEALTGATPLAVEHDVPRGVTLSVNGMVKKEYRFSRRALNGMASTRLRTREVTPEGEFLGAYIYYGIPLFNILEGVAPKKPDDAPFDRPLDMIVEVVSESGTKSLFSYGELTMTDDRHPVTLAFRREQVLPSKDPEKYRKNSFTEDVDGLKLVCPRDPDTERYLDKVVSITLTTPDVQYGKLPVMKQGKKCKSGTIQCVESGKSRKGSFDGVPGRKVTGWVRVGHGRGYKGISSASGYKLRAFLKQNFPGCGEDNYFLFVACDGYRTIFSGSEIFATEDGESFIIADKLDGKRPPGGIMLAPVDDYFVDRDVWGLTHIVLLDNDNL